VRLSLVIGSATRCGRAPAATHRARARGGGAKLEVSGSVVHERRSALLQTDSFDKPTEEAWIKMIRVIESRCSSATAPRGKRIHGATRARCHRMSRGDAHDGVDETESALRTVRSGEFAVCPRPPLSGLRERRRFREMICRASAYPSGFLSEHRG